MCILGLNRNFSFQPIRCLDCLFRCFSILTLSISVIGLSSVHNGCYSTTIWDTINSTINTLKTWNCISKICSWWNRCCRTLILNETFWVLKINNNFFYVSFLRKIQLLNWIIQLFTIYLKQHFNYVLTCWFNQRFIWKLIKRFS